MTRAKVIAWMGSVCLLGLPMVTAWAAPQDAAGETSELRPLRPADALRNAAELHRKGDYEAADRNLQQAKKGRTQLSAAEKARLDDLMKKNGEALAARVQGQDELRLAEKAVADGRGADAAGLVNSVKTNRYAAAKDQQKAADLGDEFTPKTGSTGVTRARRTLFGRESTEMKVDAEGMLLEARKALERGDLDRAESMAQAAGQAGYRGMPWKDSPSKVLRDVETARSKQVAKGGSNKNAEAKELLQQAHDAVAAGDLLKARQLVKQAEDKKADLPWWEMTPDKVRGEIAQAEMKSGVVRTSHDDKPAREVKETVKPATPAEAKMMVKDARKAFEQGDLDKAEEMAKHARVVPSVRYGLFDDTPDKVLADVIKAREGDNDSRAATLLKQARRQMETARTVEEFDDAEKLTYQAEKLKSSYSFFHRGDRPDKLRAELVARRKATIKPTLPPMDGSYARKPAEKAKPAIELASAQEKPVRTVRDNPPPPAIKSPVPPPPATPPAVALERPDESPVVIEVGKPAPRMASQAPAGRAARVNNDEGHKLVTQAEQELAKGNVVEARKLAETAYSTAPIVKVQAEQLLARIDAAQYQKDKVRAEQFYDLAVRAYKRKEYAVAASYLGNLDPKLLDEGKRVHAGEMMATEEMKQFAAVHADHEEPQGRAAASDQQAGQPAKPGLLSEVQARQLVELQKARDQKLQAEQQANRLAGQGDLDGAVNTLETALANLKGNTAVDADQLAPMHRQVEDRLKRYRTMRERVAFEKLQQQKLVAGKEAVAKHHLQESQKNEKVAELLKQHASLMDQGKFREAAVVAMKAHEIDPDSTAADVAVFKAQTMQNLASEHGLLKDKEKNWAAAMHDTERAANAEVDDTFPVKYPANWREKDPRVEKRYLRVKALTPQDREIKSKLDTSVVSVDFRNKPLGEVLDELRTMTNVNIVPDKPSLELDGVSLNQPVSMRLDGVKLSVALKRILNDARLTYVISDGLLLVTTPQGERGKIERVVYPIADLIVPAASAGEGVLSTLLGTQSVARDNVNASMNEYSTPYGLQGGQNVSQVMGSHAPQVSKSPRVMDRTLHDVLIKLIQDTIEPASWDSMGGSGHVEYFPLGMSLVVSQTSDIQEQIQLLLDRLRELQELQVTVEVRLLALSEQFYERIGIDFQVKIDDDQTRFERQVVNNNFAPVGQINAPDHLDGVVVGLTPAGTLTSDLDIPIRNSSFGLATPPFGGFPSSTDGRNGGLTTGLAFLSDIEVYLLLEAAQGDRRNNVLQAPKVTLYNGQTASISNQTERRFITDFNVVTDFFGNIIVDPVVTSIPSGLFLTVQAVISADRRYVRLSINPTVITIDPVVPTFEIDVGFGPQQVQQPIVTILQVQTTVSVPDGGTILLGGIKTLSEGRNEFGPPILNKLPYVNRLFKNVGYGREATTLLMMVTPYIIIPEEEEERLGQTFAF